MPANPTKNITVFTPIGDQTMVLAQTGTVQVNGTTPVVVADPRVTINSMIDFSLNTVGGTVGARPTLSAISPGVSFTVVATAADTSTYNYSITG